MARRGARPDEAPLRLFAAFELPARAVHAVREAVEPWREAFPGARWVPPENWHVTVKFLGWTAPLLVGWVRDRLREAASAVSPLETRLTGFGSFPSARRARVLWAGLDDDAGRMAGIARALDEALAEEFAPERRPFRAHVTVARSDPPVPVPDAFAATPLEAIVVPIEGVTLFRSVLRRPAPRYEPLARFPLGA